MLISAAAGDDDQTVLVGHQPLGQPGRKTHPLETRDLVGHVAEAGAPRALRKIGVRAEAAGPAVVLEGNGEVEVLRLVHSPDQPFGQDRFDQGAHAFGRERLAVGGEPPVYPEGHRVAGHEVYVRGFPVGGLSEDPGRRGSELLFVEWSVHGGLYPCRRWRAQAMGVPYAGCPRGLKPAARGQIRIGLPSLRRMGGN
jgi:hypothetical protein